MANGRTREGIELSPLSKAPSKLSVVAHQFPGVLVALDISGTQANLENTQQVSYPPDNNSRVFGKRVHAWYQDGKNLTQPKHTDDKSIIGYTSEGLPFQVMVNGEARSDDSEGRTKIFNFVSQNISPLMDLYAEKLSDSATPELLIRELIRIIDNMMPRDNKPKFTLSLALTYSKNNHLFVAGFGVGDTGIVLQSVNPQNGKGELKQLTHTTHLEAYDSQQKDSFGITDSKIDDVMERSNVFNEPVYAGDELFGYTYLFPELLEEEDSKIINRVAVFQTKLSPNNLNSYSRKARLFDAAKIAMNEIFEDLRTNAEEERLNTKFGDDCMLSSVFIPKDEERTDIKTKIFHHELNRLEDTISRLKDGEVKKQAGIIHERAQKLASSEDLTELARDLAVCHRALSMPNNANMKALHRRANKPHQFPSLGRMALSAALIVLGATLTLLGAFLILGGAALLPTGPFSGIGIGGIIGGSIIAATGISVVGTGIGMFANGYRGKAITKLKNILIEENHLAPFPPSR